MWLASVKAVNDYKLIIPGAHHKDLLKFERSLAECVRADDEQRTDCKYMYINPCDKCTYTIVCILSLYSLIVRAHSQFFNIKKKLGKGMGMGTRSLIKPHSASFSNSNYHNA